MKNSNNKMRILFLGSCTFGDRTSAEICAPFEKIKDYLLLADVVFLNIEGNITTRKEAPRDSDAHFMVSDGQQLLSLKKIIPHTPIIVNFKSENMFAMGNVGFHDTQRFLTKHEFLYNPSVLRPLIYGTLCVFNLIDSKLLPTSSRVMDYVLPVHIHMIWYKRTIIDVIRLFKRPLRKLIVTIKLDFTENFPSVRAEQFCETLIDNGVDIVFGYGHHNVAFRSTRAYKTGIIILSLGDLINCCPEEEVLYDPQSNICMYTTPGKTFYTGKVQRKMVENCILPY